MRDFDFSCIPADLTEFDQWVFWRSEMRGGKATKIPCMEDGEAASVTKRQDWVQIRNLKFRLEHKHPDYDYEGIGFVFDKDDPFTGIDLDNSLDDAGKVKPWAQPIIERFADTYIEVSPSGRGVKIWAGAQLPGKGHSVPYEDGRIEIYDRARFFTVTGHPLNGDLHQVTNHQEDVTWLYNLIGKRKGKIAPATPPSGKIPTGNRHQTLLTLGGAMRNRGATEQEIYAALAEMNRSRCNPPKTEAEIRKIAHDVAQFPAGKVIFETPPPERPARKAKAPAATAQEAPAELPAPSPPAERLIPLAGAPSVVKPAARSEQWRLNLIRRKSTATEQKQGIESATVDKAALANSITALRQAPEWAGVLAYNEFTVGTAALKPPPWPDSSVGDWTDHEDRLTADWLQHQGIMASVEVTGHAVQAVARDASFHPVREYLDSLKWDGTRRIDQWLNVYLGVEHTPYSSAVGARWLISGVARIYQPGAKVDCCLILEGPQGSLKSTALRTLAGDWFTDELADLGSKDSALQTRGTWIIELSELDSMTRSEVGRVKAFMSRAADRFRPPYGRHLIESPRQCVFAGSVNHTTYLRDETGGRRFWPVGCGAILISELEQHRDHLWAEAVARYRGGSVWWLETPELNSLAQQEQADRYEDDPWGELITPWTAGRDSVSVADVLRFCIEKKQDQWTQGDRNRVAHCLLALGWQRYRQRTGNRLGWCYRRERT